MNMPAKKTEAQPPATTAQSSGLSLLPEEIRLPIVGIMQDKNHLMDQSDKYETGMIVDYSSGEIISRRDENNIDFINFIPIHARRVYICKNPRQRDSKMFDKTLEPNELIFKTENPADERIAEEMQLAQDRDCKPRVRKFLQYLCYVEGSDMPMIISFGGGNRVPGEQLLTKINFAKVDCWRRKYKLTTFLSNFKEFNFYKFAFERIGDPTDEELETVKDWAETIATQDYQPEIEPEEEEPEVETPAAKKTAPPSDTEQAPY